jgi:hypothetical protein
MSETSTKRSAGPRLTVRYVDATPEQFEAAARFIAQVVQRESAVSTGYQELRDDLHAVHERRLARADRQAEQRQGGRSNG